MPLVCRFRRLSAACIQCTVPLPPLPPLVFGHGSRACARARGLQSSSRQKRHKRRVAVLSPLVISKLLDCIRMLLQVFFTAAACLPLPPLVCRLRFPHRLTAALTSAQLLRRQSPAENGYANKDTHQTPRVTRRLTATARPRSKGQGVPCSAS
jgi:hypothetical protein